MGGSGRVAPVDGTERRRDADGPGRDGSTAETVRTVEGQAAADLLALLEDGYARELLGLLEDGPRSARELVEASGASRATVYRRLDRLEAHGLLEADLEPHRDGHHRQLFRSTFRRATVDLDGTTPLVRLVLSVPADEPGVPTPLSAD
jgi:DNA-binding transcriptional ArsR family regulator